jgi:hypothetical protein
LNNAAIRDNISICCQPLENLQMTHSPAQEVVEKVEQILEERKVKTDRRVNHTRLPASIERRKNPDRRHKPS